MTSLKGTPVENIKLDNAELKRFPNGHVFWYYIVVDKVSIRISGNLYKQLKRVKMDGRELA